MNKKILIVDDEPGIVRLLGLRLKAKGYEVYEASDGFQGVTIAEQETPDLILMDIKMPNMGGIMAFEELIKLEATKDIPVLFMTAFPTAEIKDQVLKMGAKGCMSKPFVSVDFEKNVEKVINNYTLDEDQKTYPSYATLN